MNQKEWDSLGLSNDFLFGKVMQDPELCKELLETILDIPIDHVEYPEVQKSIDISLDAKGVRLDVYVKDEKNTVYNIEMQTVFEAGLPKRSRYYQSMIDLALIKKGELYKNLAQSYVIFICTFDGFGKGEPIYTFQNMCKEVPGLSLNDGSCKIFLNAKGTGGNVSEKLQAFLEYIVEGKIKTPKDAFIERLDKAVKSAKQNGEWRREYMTLYMRDLENIEKGRQEATVNVCQQFGLTKAATMEIVKRDFELHDGEAMKIVERYWK